MTILTPVPDVVKCPNCSSELPSKIRYCWRCGYPIHKIHETCSICSGPMSPPRRHKGPLGLAYYCGCGFTCTTEDELNRHLEAMK
jgi:hypothetical protein